MPSSGPSLLPSSEPSLLPSSQPSDAPSLAPSTSSKPSKVPSIRPTGCVNDDNWIDQYGLNCTQIERLVNDIDPEFCNRISGKYTSNDKTVDQACCICGGSIFQSRSPSSLPSLETSSDPSSSPSFKPSSMPSSSPSSLPSLTPSLLPSSQPSQLPSSLPSDIPSLSRMPSNVPSLSPSSMPSTTPSTSLLPTLAAPNAFELVFRFTDVKLSDLDESQRTALKEDIENGLRNEFAPLTLEQLVVTLVDETTTGRKKARRLEEGVEATTTFEAKLKSSDAESEEKLAQISTSVSAETGYEATAALVASQSPSDIPSGEYLETMNRFRRHNSDRYDQLSTLFLTLLYFC